MKSSWCSDKDICPATSILVGNNFVVETKERILEGWRFNPWQDNFKYGV
jgi:hypothetical protein